MMFVCGVVVLAALIWGVLNARLNIKRLMLIWGLFQVFLSVEIVIC